MISFVLWNCTLKIMFHLITKAFHAYRRKFQKTQKAKNHPGSTIQCLKAGSGDSPSLPICVCFLCCQQNKQNRIPHIVSSCMFSIEISHVRTIIIYSDITWKRKIKTILREKNSSYAFSNCTLLRQCAPAVEYRVGVPCPPSLHSGQICTVLLMSTRVLFSGGWYLPSVCRNSRYLNGFLYNQWWMEMALDLSWHFNLVALSSCLAKGGLPDPIVCLDTDIGHSCLCLLLLVSFTRCQLAILHSGPTYWVTLVYMVVWRILHLPPYIPSLRRTRPPVFRVYFHRLCQHQGGPSAIWPSRLILGNFEEKHEKSLNACPEVQVSQSGTNAGAGGGENGAFVVGLGVQLWVPPHSAP